MFLSSGLYNLQDLRREENLGFSDQADEKTRRRSSNGRGEKKKLCAT